MGDDLHNEVNFRFLVDLQGYHAPYCGLTLFGCMYNERITIQKRRLKGINKDVSLLLPLVDPTMFYQP
jgi:hypothetical protein